MDKGWPPPWDGCIDGPMGGWVSGWVQMGGCVEEEVDGVDQWVDGMGGWVNGCISAWVDVWVGELVGGWIYECIVHRWLIDL